MNHFARNAAIVSTIALLSAGSGGLAYAQDGGCTNPQDCPGPQIQESDKPGQDYPSRRQRAERSEGEDQNSDDAFRRKRRIDPDTDVGERQFPGGDDDYNKRRKQARYDWKFDDDKHERRRHRDKRFRFEFDGYWYPEQYWYGYGYSVNYGISCGEGRELLFDRGFRRVRVIECQGRTFTYLGRRQGDVFRVLVSSRTGRIVGVRPA